MKLILRTFFLSLLILTFISCKDTKKEEDTNDAVVEEIEAVEAEIDEISSEVDKEAKELESALNELDNI